ncbi:hypothetical protein QJS10_CPA01g02408 [Acorus calamus]|uniref:DUF4378 domain-containing protein n=1 Tax=Acorus calamus TaxID=4465 RepID=A0AAV9FJM2_ACOCL|nr:hypothetical protein QJS10_CPA01g02408 [Acorus calamus]
MSGVLHLFDFHQLLFSTSPTTNNIIIINNNHLKSTSNSGVEAPRNSLESSDDCGFQTPLAVLSDYHDLDIPMSIQILPKPESSISSSSGSTPKRLRWRTASAAEEEYKKPSPSSTSSPNVVARLMGLDAMPDFEVPTTSSSSSTPRRPWKTRTDDGGGSRSLPDTPRISSARRSDVESSRLSLQLNRENNNNNNNNNNNACKHRRSRSSSFTHRDQENHKKQVKETLGTRKTALSDITNQNVRARDNSGSPRLSPQTALPSPPPPPPPPPPPAVKLKELKPTNAAKSVRTKRVPRVERFTERLRKPPQETVSSIRGEALVRRRRGANTSNAVEKRSSTPPPSPPLPIKTESLNNKMVRQDEYNYVKRILESTGVAVHGDASAVTNASWYSPSHPVDPTTFLRLERAASGESYRGSLSRRCNRRLLFHVVDEVLRDLLSTHLYLKPWVTCGRSGAALTGEGLIGRLWREITGYPSADCRVLQDIDALIGRDLPESHVRGVTSLPHVREEVWWVATEIERGILDSLISDTAIACARM